MPRAALPRHELAHRTRYRYGDRYTDARKEHTDQTVEWRHQITRAVMAPIEAVLLTALRGGVPLRQACEAVGVSVVAVHGRRRWDPDWAAQIDSALMAGRDPNLEHGREQAYRHGGCRCPECRQAHDATRSR